MHLERSIGWAEGTDAKPGASLNSDQRHGGWAEGSEAKTALGPADGGRVAAAGAAPPEGLWRHLCVLCRLSWWLALWPLTEAEAGGDGVPRPAGGSLQLLALFSGHVLALLGLTAASVTAVARVMPLNTMMLRYTGGISTSALVSSVQMLGGVSCWLLLAPTLYWRRRRLARLLARWSRLEAAGAAGVRHARAADWLLPTAVLTLTVAAPMLEFDARNVLPEHSGTLVGVIVFVWRLYMQVLWHTGVLLPLALLCHGARELRRQTRWLGAELRQPVTEERLTHLTRLYNQCCGLSDDLCSSLSPAVFSSHCALNFSTIFGVYLSLVSDIPRCVADPSRDNITIIICMGISICVASGLLIGTFNICQAAVSSGEEARRRLKHAAAAAAAAEPHRQQQARLVLDHLLLTASQFYTLDRGTAFQQAYNLLSMSVILIQFAQSERT